MKASQIALGTANFGLHYGVKNPRQVPLNEVERILDACRTCGVTTMDTAIGYGESQRVLGRAGSQDFDCTTKLPGLPAAVDNVEELVCDQVAKALLDLRQERLYGLLLHRPQDLLGTHGPELAKAMRHAQDKFNIQKLGVSVYEPQELLDCWKVLQYDLVQLPCNVFDQRFTAESTVEHLSAKNIEVHARSAFLQGLLLMETSSRPAYFNPWAHVFEAWQDLVRNSEKSPLELCLAFAHEQGFVHKWVIGVDSDVQLIAMLNAAKSLDGHQIRCDWSAFKGLPLELISPAQWSLQ
jgi:aryl-alcohol dehydrogenase-like predicted oxidoreductase